MLGSFVALDLLLFFVFFEALLVPMYLHRSAGGGSAASTPPSSSSCYTMAGSAFLLVGILFLYSRSAGPVGRGRSTSSSSRRWRAPLPASTARWLFLAFFVAFAVKVPLFPLHTWLPDAHTEAPTAGSVLPGRRPAEGRRVRPDPLQPARCSPRRRSTSPPSCRSWRVIGSSTAPWWR